MTTTKRTALGETAKELVAGGRDLMNEALQEIREAEMRQLLGAGPSERTEERKGYRSGYYARNLVTRIGKLEPRVQRDRNGGFSTALFERCGRSEKALVAVRLEAAVSEGLLANDSISHNRVDRKRIIPDNRNKSEIPEL